MLQSPKEEQSTRPWEALYVDTAHLFACVCLFLLFPDLVSLKFCYRFFELSLLALCPVVHLGHDYSTTYELHHNGKPRVLDESVEETDLGVYMLIPV